ncbi:MAG: hypothetical protein IJ620_03135 [Bacteroidales bacterium]|nr:hypothetical protein [Bacteroidales bacterium]
MKHIKFILSLFIIAMSVAVSNPMMAQTRKEKRAAKKAAWDAEQKFQAEVEAMKRQLIMDSLNAIRTQRNARGTYVELPCVDLSYDDDAYIRELGIGSNANEMQARRAAELAAKQVCKDKMAEFVQGLSTDYVRNVMGNSAGNDMQSKMEGGMMSVVEGMLNRARKTCDKCFQNNRGTWDAYYVVEIPVVELQQKLAVAAAESDRIDFNAAQFQKFMDERLQAMKDSKKEAGY